MDIKDISWIAGLLEGEGCFHHSRSVSIRMQMADEDVVRRAAKILDAQCVGPIHRAPLGRCGTSAYVVLVNGCIRALFALGCVQTWQHDPMPVNKAGGAISPLNQRGGVKPPVSE